VADRTLILSDCLEVRRRRNGSGGAPLLEADQ
jgi:hypothetical protein